MLCVLESEKSVEFTFVGEKEVHSLPWCELLTVEDEAPFVHFDEVAVGEEVMAPWTDGDDVLQYARAIVVNCKGTLYVKIL